MMYYSAKELCCLYPEKYIAVKVIEQSYPDTEILKCQVLKVYNTLEDCQKRANELRLFQKLFKEQFDVIYGDFDDYMDTRGEKAFHGCFGMLGGIAFDMFGMNLVDAVIKAVEESRKNPESIE